MISVIIPTFNAEATLARALQPLVDGVLEGVVREVIVADGGSADATTTIADDAGCVVVRSEKGRGRQLIAGAAAARGSWLLFLHADTVLNATWVAPVKSFIRAGEGKAAYFRFAGDDDSAAARRLEFWVRARCAVFALPYGDQGLVIARSLYEAVGGFRPLDLMEDVDLVRRLGRARLQALACDAVTSFAKFKRDGYLRRSSQNLWLLARFLLGADPAQLARRYD